VSGVEAEGTGKGGRVFAIWLCWLVLALFLIAAGVVLSR
jgi:hypothetical protein